MNDWWLIGLLVLVIITSVCFLVLRRPGSALKMGSARITKGMSREEVEAILGRPQEEKRIDDESIQASDCTWREPPDARQKEKQVVVVVWFDNNRVSSVEVTAPETIYDQIRDWMKETMGWR